MGAARRMWVTSSVRVCQSCFQHCDSRVCPAPMPRSKLQRPAKPQREMRLHACVPTLNDVHSFHSTSITLLLPALCAPRTVSQSGQSPRAWRTHLWLRRHAPQPARLQHPHLPMPAACSRRRWWFWRGIAAAVFVAGTYGSSGGVDGSSSIDN